MESSVKTMQTQKLQLDNNPNLFQQNITTTNEQIKQTIKEQQQKQKQIPPQKFIYSLSPFQADSSDQQVSQNQLINETQQQKDQSIEVKGSGENEVILVRHGTSVFNLISESFKAQTGFTFKDKQAYFNFDEKLLDTQLHQKGVLQAQGSQSKFNKLQIHTVFVSPLKRTLQTCYYIFKDHPQRSQIKFVVLPLVSEIYSKVCDVFDGKTFEDQELKQFFDFSQVNAMWQVENIQDDNLKSKIYKDLVFDNNNIPLNLEKTLLKYVELQFPKNVESYQSVFERGQKVKEFIKQYKQQHNITQDQKIVIVSHNSYLRNFTASGPDDGKGKVNGLKFANCQAVAYRY